LSSRPVTTAGSEPSRCPVPDTFDVVTDGRAADAERVGDAPHAPALAAHPCHDLRPLLSAEVPPEEVGGEHEGDSIVVRVEALELLRVVGNLHALGPQLGPGPDAMVALDHFAAVGVDDYGDEHALGGDVTLQRVVLVI